jgi:hypothetical protein
VGWLALAVYLPGAYYGSAQIPPSFRQFRVVAARLPVFIPPSCSLLYTNRRLHPPCLGSYWNPNKINKQPLTNLAASLRALSLVDGIGSLAGLFLGYFSSAYLI